MSIQSTVYINRKFAIERIIDICTLVQTHNFVELAENTFEPNEDINNVEHIMVLDVDYVAALSNHQLETIMDWPFIRLSMFDNYIIREGD